MDISVLMKVVGMGLIVAVSHQILSKTGRDEVATWVSIAGILLILLMLMGYLGDLFSNIKKTFGL